MLKLGRAQGVAIAAPCRLDYRYAKYSAQKVKQSITGNGNAGKEQVLKMLENSLHLKAPITTSMHLMHWRLPYVITFSKNGITWELWARSGTGKTSSPVTRAV